MIGLPPQVVCSRSWPRLGCLSQTQLSLPLHLCFALLLLGASPRACLRHLEQCQRFLPLTQVCSSLAIAGSQAGLGFLLSCDRSPDLARRGQCGRNAAMTLQDVSAARYWSLSSSHCSLLGWLCNLRPSFACRSVASFPSALASASRFPASRAALIDCGLRHTGHPRCCPGRRCHRQP